ncbi:hypothetical protein ACFL15_02610 [Patescibacteria group bacterium]
MKRIAKWLFFVLWIFCVVGFIIGQLIAPPEYHLLPNNLWGNFFGICVIVGFLSFCAMGVFIGLDRKTVTRKEKRKEKNKYDFSIKRIVSRLLLTILVGIVFGISMFPFLRVANGLLYEQRAAIGGQNMIKAVILWGIFTLIVTLYAFWKKHFRMVSILLIVCWVISIGFVLMINIYDANNYRCNRANPYAMPSEFNRALDLISQRAEVDSSGSNTIWQTIFNFRNCLDIQYSDANNEEVEAYFQYPLERSQNNLQDLKIVVNPSYKNFDDLTLAALLSHEIVHAGQYINEVIAKESLGCYEKEARAFTAQHAFILSLNQEEQRSIYTRLRDDVTKNPTIAIFLLTGERGNEAAQACTELQRKNNWNEEETIKCSWDELETMLLEDIKEDSYYKEQCFGF